MGLDADGVRRDRIFDPATPQGCANLKPARGVYQVKVIPSDAAADEYAKLVPIHLDRLEAPHPSAREITLTTVRYRTNVALATRSGR